MYVAFVVDAHARRILAWKVSTRMTIPLVLDGINEAIWVGRGERIADLSGLIHRNVVKSRYTSIAFTDRLIEAGMSNSVGTVGDAYDNSLRIGERALQDRVDQTARTVADAAYVEAETADYLWWFNNDRLYEFCGDVPPIECEQLHFNRDSVRLAS